jgi:uncharacterized membrane protein
VDIDPNPLAATPSTGSARRTTHSLCSRSGLARLVHALALLGTLAGIAHILSVLLVPRYAVFDAASRFLSAGADARAELVTPDGNGVSPILDADDLTEIAVCGYDLEDGPLRVSARAGTTPLAISLHIRGGGVVYAVTDRAAQRGVIEFVVLNRQQFDERAARDDDGDSQRELRVVSPALQGIVVARALVRQPSDRPGAQALVSAMACGGAG